MSYRKTTWVDGDIITAAGLNNIEDGVEALSEDTDTALRVNPQSLTVAEKNQVLSNLGLTVGTVEEARNFLGLT